MTIKSKMSEEVEPVARELDERRRVVRMEILGKVREAMDNQDEDSYDLPGVPEGELYTFYKVVSLLELLEEAALKRGAGEKVLVPFPEELKGPMATCESLQDKGEDMVIMDRNYSGEVVDDHTFDEEFIAAHRLKGLRI